jgi:cytochrome c-type biogenesis protein CcmH/NrfF
VVASEDGQIAVDLDEIATLVVEGASEAGLPLPEVETDFGEIVIYESEELAAAQSVAQAINQMGWMLPFIALLLIIGSVWSAPDRRWITAFLGFGTAFGMLLSLAGLRIGRNVTLSTIEDEVTRAAGEATWDMVLDRLIKGSWGILVLGLIIGFVAWAIGPSPRAQQFTSWAIGTVDSWRRPAEADPSGFATFLAGSKRTIEMIVVAIGLLFVLFGPSLSALRVLLITLVVVGIVVVIEILAGPAEATQEPSLPESERIDA